MQVISKKVLLSLAISLLLVNADYALMGLGNAKAQSVIVQADGKIVIAGTADVDNVQQGIIARYNADGTLDNSFNGGSVTTQVGDNAVFNDVIQQTDGKLVVAGTAELSTAQQYFVARYNTDGTLDTNFGYQGISTSVQGQSTTGTAIAQQADGKLVLVGVSAASNFIPRFFTTRLNGNGTIDTSFGLNGVVHTQNGNSALATAVKIQPDGKILVSGTAQTSQMTVRYNSNGTLDITFGNSGVSTVVVGSTSANNTSAVQTDGKIIIGGFANNDFSLIRLNTNGTLDTTWGTAGRVLTPFPSTSEVHAAVIQSDGKVIAAGYMDNQVALARYTTTGVLDTTFGATGLITNQFGSMSRALGAALQTDGKLVIAGSTPPNLFVARHSSTGVMDTSFGTVGVITIPTVCDTALCAYAQVYNTAEVNILNNDLFTFNANGAIQNITHDTASSTTDIILEQDGIYWAVYIIEANSPANVYLQLNGNIILSSNFVSQGSAIAVGEATFNATAGDVLTVKNISGYDIFLLGGAVNASITLARIG